MTDDRLACQTSCIQQISRTRININTYNLQFDYNIFVLTKDGPIWAQFVPNAAE
jgi:hypothetical protein